MLYMLRTILVISVIVIVFFGIRKFNERIKQKIKDDVINHFESKDYQIVSISQITKNSKEMPFNVNHWVPLLGKPRNYYASRYWKVELLDSENVTSVKWVNSVHIFLSQYHFEVRDDSSNKHKASA